MMNVGVVVEGQVSWDLWRRFVTTVEDLGFESLWHSDHLFSLSGDRTRDVLDPYVAFALAAELTERVRFGPLVYAYHLPAPVDTGPNGGPDRRTLGRQICGWRAPAAQS